MTPRRDDDALSWDGDDDPTLDVGAAAADEADADPARDAAGTRSGTATASAPDPELPEGYRAVGRGSEEFASSDADRPVAEQGRAEVTADSPSMGNAELVSLGVLGGFAALYAVGWLIGGLRLQGTAQFLVAPLAYQVSLWLGVLAPLVWFAAVLVVTRGRRLWVRFAWLIGGTVLLVPWPFIMVGAIGQ